ncbi:peptidylprolyl isomerase [Spirochaeta africana]|uniref:peptidylprolyl isomerase n=1 Tax=Spirochaeta africana (strain ATCC 700263 / DSM 8902 / Z-7692) TaxID=889378 RepID=H9UMI9_SPIAZ|nr:peptidylprolyl isomerase [Spirochaeta africana]AFG38732.1 peptidyl-prolyl cis-trans isomerase (rotamase) - cyclophilin family [Spirochaeta africana DSM 8902]
MRYIRMIITAAVLAAVAGCTSANAIPEGGRMSQGELVKLTAADGSTVDHELENGLYAVMETSKGSILLNLEYQRTPLTVTNFVGLAEGTIDNDRGDGPFYDGLTFHRVIENFMIQGGDPQGTGSGGPGYRFPDEIRSELRHDAPGILSMANAGPGTNGSQFFITHEPTPWLDGRHTVFGAVVAGQDVVNAVAQGDTIEQLRILRVGDEAQQFTADQSDFDSRLEELRREEMQGQEAFMEEQRQDIADRFDDLQDGPDGLQYTITAAGSGEPAREGQTVRINYTGSFVHGQVFDSSEGREPLEFQLGGGQIIPGFDLAVRGMQPGEKRTAVIPPHLAYGEQGAGGVIPPNAYLVFEIELLD